MKFVGKAIEIIQALRNRSGMDLAAGNTDNLKRQPADQNSDSTIDNKAQIQPAFVERRTRPRLTLTLKALGGQINPFQQAADLSNALHDVIETIIQSDEKYTEVNLTRPCTIAEPTFPMANVARGGARDSYYRFRASTEAQSISVRASDGLIEVFLIQADDIPLLSFSEFGSRLKGRFELTRTTDGYCWKLSKKQATSDEAILFVQRCLNELLEAKGDEEVDRPSERIPSSQADSVQQLLLEKENLIFKVLNQQEIIKNELARSLHDTVLADLLMLKRHMRGDQELSRDDIIETIDEISQQLRDICNECAPRNLHDWGLKTSLQDMLQRMGQRTAIDCSLISDVDIPNLPDTVELHIFRLVQECLNNIEKHAKATKVTIYIERGQEKSIRFKVSDNGKGFTPGEAAAKQSSDSGGMGVTGMKERTDLIRCFFPTEFAIQSAPGQGTTVSLEITMPAQVG